MCGTPAYMAPEVCAVNLDSRRYDYKVDSWSVGVTILHMYVTVVHCKLLLLSAML